jgi:signal transduction histidine kinase
VGLLQGFLAFTASANALAFSLAIILQVPALFLVFYLPASFPSGHLDPRGRLVMAFTAGVLLLRFVPKLLVSDEISGGAPGSRCAAECPENRLLVVSDPSLAALFRDMEQWGRVAAGVLLVALLVSRLTRASRPRRRMLLPVYVTVTCWLAAYTAYTSALAAGASDDTLDRLGVGLAVSRLLYPLGFVAAILLARAYAGKALQSTVAALAGRPSERSIERIVRGVLDDPGAWLAFRGRTNAHWVDPRGRTVEIPEPGGGVTADVFENGAGEPLVAVVHDPVLDEDRELVVAVGRATALALENRRLDETLRAANVELRASQRRLASAVAGERRLMQRDLHDGSQQRLVALRIQLELAREAESDPELRERLAAIGSELEVALDELRAVARGIYPSLLADMGLREALEAACRRSGLPVELDLRPVPRYPDEIEAAVYFSCVEALQNAAKHAGRDARAELRLWADDDEVHFCVRDEGVGFDRGLVRDGSGLTNIATGSAPWAARSRSPPLPGWEQRPPARFRSPDPAAADREIPRPVRARGQSTSSVQTDCSSCSSQVPSPISTAQLVHVPIVRAGSVLTRTRVTDPARSSRGSRRGAVVIPQCVGGSPGPTASVTPAARSALNHSPRAFATPPARIGRRTSAA